MVIIHKKHKESTDEKDARLQQEERAKEGIQDEYQALGFELVSWVQHHKGIVIGLIVAVLGLGALSSAYFYYQKRESEIASGAYLNAIKTIDDLQKTDAKYQEKIEVTKNKLSEVADAYKSSGVAALANLYSASLALEAGDKEAVAHYEATLKDLKKSDPLYPLALIGLGYAQEKAGDKPAALKSFESVLELKTDVGADLALWESARLHSELKSFDKAKEAANKLIEEYPASTYEKNAKRLRGTL